VDILNMKLDVPSKPFECLAYDFYKKSDKNKEIVDRLIAEGKSAFYIGKLIFYGLIKDMSDEK